MPQLTITGYSSSLDGIDAEVSEVVQVCAEEFLGVGRGKCAVRFVRLAGEDLQPPDGRSERYTLVELRLFAGRPVAAKKAFYAALYERFAALGVEPVDLEIVITDVPAYDWAVRGRPGDEL
jgi:hypothetical protein